MADKNVNELMPAIGKPGKFQMLVYAYLCVNMGIIFSNHLTMVFYAAKTKHHCRITNNQKVTDLVPTQSTKDSTRQWDGCRLYTGNNTTSTIPCTNGWTYYLEEGEATIISEFNLVCDDAYKADLATTIYFCGVMLGGFPFGILSDKYGRKLVHGLTLLASGFIGITMVIFRTYVAFAILKFFSGFVMQGLQNSSFVMAMELFSTKHRGCAGVVIGAVGNGGAMLFALLAYLVKDWKYIQLVLSILPFVLLIPFWFVPESIRWHLLHGHVAKAEAVVKRAVSFNKLPFPREIFNRIKCDSTKNSNCATRQRKANVVDMFRSSTLRKVSLILIIVCFSVAASFFGLALNISFLFGNKYLNFAIGALTDVCAVSAMAWAVTRFGRRRPLAFAFFLCAMANVTCAIIAGIGSESSGVKWLRTASALFGKACAASSLCVMFLFTSELYQTVVRNVSLGVNTFWCRIGGMAAPQIFFLGLYTSTSVPYGILAAMTLLTSVFMMVLPETHNMALVDRLEHMGQRRKAGGKDELQGVVRDDMIYETSM